MRKQLCAALVARSHNTRLVFLTGDLGFMALEELQESLGPRFINAGVAEQNMVSVAAAMARQGLETWVYSIAPFCYARPFEQIRNDIAFHGLPVKLIGNGGGYGYGVMGPTHHAIEDYGILLTLPEFRVFVPVFDEDVAAVIDRAAALPYPAYLRMGRGEPPKDYAVPTYAPWRLLVTGEGPVVIAVGPLAGLYLEQLLTLPRAIRPNLWAVAELPILRNPIPPELLEQMATFGKLCIAEEHVRHGSVASELALCLAESGVSVGRFEHLYARAHHFDRYGSQAYLRKRSSLDPDSLLNMLKAMTGD